MKDEDEVKGRGKDVVPGSILPAVLSGLPTPAPGLPTPGLRLPPTSMRLLGDEAESVRVGEDCDRAGDERVRAGGSGSSSYDQIYPSTLLKFDVPKASEGCHLAGL